jgi:ATP-dependent protease ClpP protease subunit/phage major head subunit gpT-like protein
MEASKFRCSKKGNSADLYIYDDIHAFGITDKMVLDELKKLGPISDLNIYMNSGGGDVFMGFAIRNILSRFSARKIVIVDGIAASIASVIAMVGDEIHMPEAAWMMIHDPTGVTIGSAEDHEKMAETLRGIKESIVSIYSARTGIDTARIQEMMAAETWMNGKVAVEKGFATSLLERPAIAASVDLSRFTNVPAEARKILLRETHMSDSNQTDETVKATVEEQAPHRTNVDRRALIDQLVSESTPAQTPQKTRSETDREEDDKRAKTQDEIRREAARIAAIKQKQISDVYTTASRLNLVNEAQQMLDAGVEPSDVQVDLVELFARKQARATTMTNLIPSGGGVQFLFSNEDPKVIYERMAKAIASDFVPSIQVTDDIREYKSWRAQDYMRNMLDRRGRDTRRMTRAEIVNEAMHTTSDFPNLLGTAANKIFIGSYEAAPATFRSVMGQVNLTNFQAHNLLRDGDYPALAKVLESGEFTYGTISESKESATLDTYGRSFTITRKALINDSLGVFGRMVAKIGQAVARFENKTAWAVVQTNGAMSDTGNLYNATAVTTTGGHANLTTSSGTAISGTSLGVARKTMRLQKSLDGETLNVIPRYLVVPAAKETIAEQVLFPLTPVSTAVDLATRSLQSLVLVVEPLLDGTATIGTTAWYLFSDPMVGAAIVYGYLEGESAPRIRVDDPFDVDGIKFQVRLDFHASAADWRFTYCNTGA